MSHQVEFHDTVTTADGEGTWHNINTQLVSKMETLEDTRLDWDVEKYPVIFERQEGNVKFRKAIPDQYVTVRQDINLPLGIVGSQYEIIQNSRVFEAVQEIFQGKAKLKTAGSLFNCKQIWFLAELEFGDQTINGDQHKNYLLASSSHDGSRRLEFRQTSVRVVCNNTLTHAIKSTKDCVKVPHSACAKFRIIEAEKFYSEVYKGLDEQKSLLEQLAEKPCTAMEAYNWASGFVHATSTKSQNISREITNLFGNGAGNQGETRYDLLNGVTERFTHGSKTSDQSNSDRVKRFISSTFEGDAIRKNSALDALLDEHKFAKLSEYGAKYNGTYLESESARNSRTLVPLTINR